MKILHTEYDVPVHAGETWSAGSAAIEVNSVLFCSVPSPKPGEYLLLID